MLILKFNGLFRVFPEFTTQYAYFAALRQTIYSHCPKWEREWVGMGIEVMGNGNENWNAVSEWEWVGMRMGMIRWEWEGNGNISHLYISPFLITLAFSCLWDSLTTSVDFDLTEVECFISVFNLHDEISARRRACSARQVDSCSLTHDTWILSTQDVVPQGGCRSCRWHVCQSNDEVVWAIFWKRKWNKYTFKPNLARFRKC